MPYHPTRLTRREAIRLLTVGASVGVVSGCRGEVDVAPAPQTAVPAPEALQFPQGAIIRTLLKDVAPEELATGMTLFHEHLSLDMRAGPPAPPRPPPFTADVDRMIDVVKAAREDGISCIVDGGHADQGRSMEALRRIANSTDMHIVASGGYWTQRTYPPEISSQTEEQIADELVREADMERFGALGEIGQTGDAMTPDERKVFRAIAQAHLRTGLPVFTHTPHAGSQKAALEQLTLLESEGVDPQKFCIGHMSDIKDDPRAETHKAVAQRGAFVGLDSATLERFNPDAVRVKMVLELLDAGYGDNVLLSSDYNGDEELFGKPEGTPRSVNGSPPGYARTLTVFVPMLRDAGVNEETIQQITVDNPRRFLAFVPEPA